MTLALSLCLAACAARSFDNPVDPDNPLEGLRFVTFFEPPADQPADLDFDRELLWVVDRANDSLYRIFARDGRSNFFCPLDLGPIFGVVWDGNALWLSQPGQGTVIRINPFNCAAGGPLQSPVPTEGGDPQGIAFDGELLWVIDGTDRSLSKIDPLVGPVGEAISVPSISRPGGLAFRGDEIWVIDRTDSRLVHLAETGEELESFDLPGGGAIGLTTDGESFFYSDRLGRINVVELLEDDEE